MTIVWDNIEYKFQGSLSDFNMDTDVDHIGSYLDFMTHMIVRRSTTVDMSIQVIGEVTRRVL